MSNDTINSNELPDGAVLLTEDLFEAASRQRVRLPFLSLRVAKMTVAELIANGYLQPLDLWTASLREQTARIVAERRVRERPEHTSLSPQEFDDAVTRESAELKDDDLLEYRAGLVREHGVWVEIGTVGFAEALAVQPVIPGSEDWPTEAKARTEAFQKWYAALPDEDKEKYNEALVEANYRFLLLGLIRPRLTLEQVRRFKDDAVYLMMAISRLSGLDRLTDSAKTDEKTGETKEAGEKPVAA